MSQDTGLARDVADWITREAGLLDDARFEEWLGLLTDDFRYWMPVSREQADPAQGVAHIHDDHAMISARMHRLAHPRAFSAEPPPDTVRLVGSITAEEEGDAVVARSKVILLEHRDRDRFEADTRTFGARVEHRLVRDGDGFLMRRKRVDALGASGSFNALMVPF